MKRLWLAAALLLLMLGGTLLNSRHLERTIDGCVQELAQAHQHAIQGDWEQARQRTERVLDDWQKHDFYFHVSLRHTDIDAIHLTLSEIQEYLALEETDQYTAANAKLMAQFELLAEMEKLSFKNIL